jgi:Ca2+-binding RTX toxin-like protein
MVGDAGANNIKGGGGNDGLWGGAGNDTIEGQDGDDTLNGQDGDDLLIGGLGVDTLNGGAGADTLQGNDGNDLLTGAAGNDLFVFSLGDDSDAIADFVAGPGTDDAISLVGFGPSYDEFSEVMAAATQVGADTVIDFGGGDMITLQNVDMTTLDASDFLFS